IAEAAGDLSYQRIFDLFAIQIWRLIALIYLTIVVILVVISLNRESTLVRNKYLRGTKTSERALKSIRLLGYRILLYPISMLVTHSGGIISQLYFDLNGKDNVGLDQWTMITYPLIGTLNFIAFCCDPTVHSTIKKACLRLQFYYSFRRSIGDKDNNNDGAFELVSDASTNNSIVTEGGDAPENSTENEQIILQRFMSTL
ncbi:hypothetical protein K502DRAFT_360021, partial [Neoconidiobolus thromboides FSU 785]